ncbi:Ig-like domain-containing protein [Exiguobacterium sp. AM39-5BH]|uniref:Ig-like domain-containing protein n=1 Tax=Exiguobacterium sp. AM39-5BH TaxID=2292355 RepID=UPI00131489C8|nr:Ig-like domain-containing protein [Exiguobacterium sp. AM39-5BH]
MNKKTIFRQFILYVMVVLLISTSVTPAMATEKNVTIDPFTYYDAEINGVSTMGEPLYVNIHDRIEPLSIRSDGTFTLTLPSRVEGRVIYFYKKSGDFYQVVKRTQAADFLMDYAFPVPTFYGVKDGKMRLKTTENLEIVAVYEGVTHTGHGFLEIKQGTSADVKAYARDPYRRSVTATYRFDDVVHLPLQIDPLTPGMWELSGKTAPFQHVRLTYDGQAYDTQSGPDGRFSMWAPFFMMLYTKGFTYKVELIDAHLLNPVVLEQTVAPLVPSATQPVHLSDFGNMGEGITYPGATIEYAGQTFNANEEGYFFIPWQIDGTSNKEIVFKRDGKTYAEKTVRQYVREDEFPFELTIEPSTLSGRIAGKTEPNVELVLKSSNGDFSFMSDESGNFTAELPRFESGEYTLHLKTGSQIQPLNHVVKIKERRALARPILTFENETLHIDASTSVPVATTAEIQITKPDGEIDVKTVRLTSGKASSFISYGDSYRIRTKFDDQYSDYISGQHQEVKAPNFSTFHEGSTVVAGTVEPYATITLQYDSRNSDQKVVQTTDGTGAFSMTVPSPLKLVSYPFVVERKNGLGKTRFSLTPTDTTAPRIYIDGGEGVVDVSEDAKLVRVSVDDEIKSMTAVFTTGSDKTEMKFDETTTRYWELEASKDGKTFKEMNISSINVTMENKAGLKKTVTLRVKDTTPPTVNIDRILFGDRVIHGKTEPGATVRFGRSDNTVTKQAAADGSFSFELPGPITTYTATMYLFVVKDAAGNQTSKYAQTLDYPIKDVRMNEAGTKLWLGNENRQFKQHAYDVLVNGKRLTLKEDYMHSTTLDLPSPVTFPVDVEVRLKNEDGTLKYAFKKTLTKSSVLSTPKQLYAESGKKTIKGQLDPYVAYEIYDASGKRIKTNVASGDGSFVSAITRPLVQNESLRVIAKDPFGQTKSMTFKVTDKTPPIRPTVNTLVVPLKQVSGKAEAGATVRVTYRNKTYTTKADTKGVYRLAVSNWQVGQMVSVTARDAAGNTSTATTTKIMNAFKATSVAPVRTTSAAVTGKADAGAYVNVYSGNRQLGKTMRVSSKATFSVAIPKQKKGTVLTVRFTRAGYATVERKVTVY